MSVENLARKSFESFFTGLGKAPAENRVQLSQRMKLLLCAGGESEVSEELFIEAFRRMEQFIVNPGLLFFAVRSKIVELLQGREDHLTQEEITYLSAYYCGMDRYFLKRLRENPIVIFDGSCEDITFNLTNPWYLSLPGYSILPLYRWSRGGDSYIQPISGSIEDRIEGFYAAGKTVYILDAGTGDAFYMAKIKSQFGDKVYTTGIGLINQKLPLDKSVMTPMEVLPKEWSERFDIITSNYALCYSPFPEKALKELLRVLKCGGVAYLDVSPVLNTFCDNIRSVAEILELDYDVCLNLMDSYYNEKDFGSFNKIKRLIESWSNEEVKFKVHFARGGKSFGICIQVLKLKSA